MKFDFAVRDATRSTLGRVAGFLWNHDHDLSRPNIVEDLLIDHVYISVADIEKSRRFYADALRPLGWRDVGAFDASSAPAAVPDLYGFADADYGSSDKTGSSIWLRTRQAGETGLYLGISADNSESVDAAYEAALKAGGHDEGGPAERAYFAPGYYAANVADFDDNHLEFVCKRRTT